MLVVEEIGDTELELQIEVGDLILFFDDDIVLLLFWLVLCLFVVGALETVVTVMFSCVCVVICKRLSNVCCSSF